MNGETQPYDYPVPLLRRRTKPSLHVILFVLTLITTTAAGALQNGVNPLNDPWGVTSGLPFSITLMTILLVHEMGHYLMSRYHGVSASLPYFLPAPPFPFIIGTFGAFIRMESPPPNRRALFDVGAAGPLAGLVLAVAAVVIGLMLSIVSHEQSSVEGIALGSSLLLGFLSEMILGVQPEGVSIVLHPIGFAGWVGLLVTMLNLLPVGQLDGGHVVYALFGPRQIWISRLGVIAILALGLARLWDGWLIWGVLLILMGARHPPPLDPHTPLDFKRQLAAWFTLAIFVITFTPVPFSIEEAEVREDRPVPKQSVPSYGAGLNGESQI